jgi:hypothetical protein
MIGVTSQYFQNYTNNSEQELLDDLIVESVSIYGIDVEYIARDVNNYDKIYGEDDSSSYTKHWQVAVYLKDVFGYSGDREFMSKIAGMEIRDQITLSLPVRTFRQEIAERAGYDRPHEGDIIYFNAVAGHAKKFFQVKYVQQFEMFYQLGSLHTWELTCELFEYSSEQFNTGIPELDILQTKFSNNLMDYAIIGENGQPLLDEKGNMLLTDAYNMEKIDFQDDTAEFDKQDDNLLDWSEDDPFADNPEHKI